ncbi:MAG: hypothetical protein ACTSUX_12220 [Promethearchaeota archaeon]
MGYTFKSKKLSRVRLVNESGSIIISATWVDSDRIAWQSPYARPRAHIYCSKLLINLIPDVCMVLHM